MSILRLAVPAVVVAAALAGSFTYFVSAPPRVEAEQRAAAPARDATGAAAANLERLLRGRPDGIFITPFETGAVGPDLFRAACDIGLEGLVSKRSDRPYRGGRSPHWIKVKNRAHHAFNRVKQAFS
jgi:hypothetical protein